MHLLMHSNASIGMSFPASPLGTQGIKRDRHGMKFYLIIEFI